MHIVKLIAALLAVGMFCTFIIGLAHSISSGFAGFTGGLPFWIICIGVLSMTLYDFWDQCLRKDKDKQK